MEHEKRTYLQHKDTQTHQKVSASSQLLWLSEHGRFLSRASEERRHQDGSREGEEESDKVAKSSKPKSSSANRVDQIVCDEELVLVLALCVQ